MRSFLMPSEDAARSTCRALKKTCLDGMAPKSSGCSWVYRKGQPMKLIAILLSMLVGGFAFAQGGAGGSNSSASPGGTAGTNVNGTNQTNQDSSYGNSASGSQTEGTNRNPTNSIK